MPSYIMKPQVLCEATLGNNSKLKKKLTRNCIASLNISELCRMAIRLHERNLLDNTSTDFMYMFDQMGPVEYSMSSFEKKNENSESYSEISLREIPSEFLIQLFDMGPMQSEIQHISNEQNNNAAGGGDMDDDSVGIDFDFDIGLHEDIGEPMNVLQSSTAHTENLGQAHESLHRIEMFNLPTAHPSTTNDPHILPTQDIPTLVSIDQSDIVVPARTRRRRSHPSPDIILSLDHYNRERTILPDVHEVKVTSKDQMSAWRAAISEPFLRILVDNLSILFQRKHEKMSYLRTVEAARISHLNSLSSIQREPTIINQTLRTSPETTTFDVELGEPEMQRQVPPSNLFERPNLVDNGDQAFDFDFDYGDLYFNQQEAGVHNMDALNLLQDDTLNLNEALASKSYSEKAIVFYHVLVLAMENKIEIIQKAPYELIDIKFK
ncbi:hypothetical protein K501DRAFT_300455 [Backusella circina FSU 941]|nr:hypothetical protein K501DRAFT_300455 [Backusella circina FSU 941]